MKNTGLYFFSSSTCFIIFDSKLTGIDFQHWVSLSHVAYWIPTFSYQVGQIKELMLEIYLFRQLLLHAEVFAR